MEVSKEDEYEQTDKDAINKVGLDCFSSIGYKRTNLRFAW